MDLQDTLGGAEQPPEPPDQKAGQTVVAPDLSVVIDDPHDRRRKPSRRGCIRAAKQRRRRRRRIIIGSVLTVLLLYLAFLGVSALMALREAKSAVQAVRQLTSLSDIGNLGNVNTTAAATALDTLSDSINGIETWVGNPGWKPLEWVPYYGKDVKAARSMIHVANTVANDAMPQLRNALGSIKPAEFGITGGTVSLPGLADAAPSLQLANPVMTQAAADLRQIQPGHIGAVTDALEQGKALIGTVADLTDGLSRFATVAPSMLDLNNSQPRTYLVLAQNNAELRATGGLPGSWGTLTVAGGRMTLGEFIPETQLPILDQPVIPLESEETNLYTDALGRIPHDVNLTPEFPRAAAIAKAMWEQANPGQTIDGVIALDPVLLQSLLGAVGSVTVDGMTLDGQNAAKVLLHEVYAKSADANWQNEFFARAAHASFARIVDGANANVMALVGAMRQAVGGGHLLLWSAQGAEQRQIEDTAVAGMLNDTPAQPKLGIYFNDLGQSKMDWYLDRRTKVTLDHANADGSKVWTVNVTLTNTLDPADVDSTPAYVLGDGAHGIAPGQLGVNVFHYTPAGGRLVSWKLPDGGDFDLLTTHDGHTVGAKAFVLDPGQSVTYTISVQTAATPNATDLTVDQTPLL